MNKIEYLKKIRELYIVIDMINGFVKEGKMAAPSIMRIVPTQYEILNSADKKADAGIAFVRDSHKKNSQEFKTYAEHCIEGTKETEVIEEIKKFIPNSIQYLKNNTNVMFAPNIQEDLLNAENLKKIKVMGCLSDYCAKDAAIGLRCFLDQYDKDIEVCVYEDAIDTFDAPGHNADEINKISVEEMKSRGIKILRKER